MNLLEIPGYAEAVQKERLIRDASFLCINEHVAGFELRPMTLRDYLTLRIIGSPLLGGETPAPEELAGFLWLMSANYHPKAKLRRWLFLQQCRRKFVPPSKPLFKTRRAMIRWEHNVAARLVIASEIIDAVRAYVKETFQDRPPTRPQVKFEKDYYSDACGICMELGREVGWSDESILTMPLKRLFQYLKETREVQHLKAGQNPILFNPSDGAINKMMEEQNRALDTSEARN